MRAFTIASVALTMFFVGGSYANAQYPYAGPTHYEVYHHSSTVEEAAWSGMARYQRAVGEANYWNAVAAERYQQAYSQYLENERQLLAPRLARIEREKQARAQRVEQRRQQQLEKAREHGENLKLAAGN